MKKRIQKLRQKREQNKLAKIDESESVPRITNENLAEHREDVLSGAKKYIYPLQHSKHRIIILSTSLFLVVLLAFSIFTVLSLYRFETRSAFMYQLTRVVPLPIARTGSTFVAYENYLFELNHYIHYYENQQQLSFDTEAGQAQLASYKERTINKVINDAYIKILAEEQGITVDETEVDEQIRIAREQNRLGSSDEIFEDVLREFWDWSVGDFRRSLKTELLAQKVIRDADSETEAKATEALARITAGEDFATIAAEYSDDLVTKDSGGEFGLVNRSNRNISQQAVDVLFKLGEGQNSGIVVVPYGTGYALAIIRNQGQQEDQRNGAHIIFQLNSLDEVLNDRKEQRPYRLYMNPVE
jgi:hypothetical protein